MNFNPESTNPSTDLKALTPDDLIGAEPAETQLVNFQQHLTCLMQDALKAQAQLNQLVLGIQRLSTLAASMPEKAIDLGEGRVLSPMWNSETAIELLSERTGQKWTHPKLLVVAIAKGWRSSAKGHKPLASLYCTRVMSRMNPEGTIAYTHRALQYIIDNKEECWLLATSKSLGQTSIPFKGS